MRPANLKTRIFLDSGGADETKIALEAIGFLDGQTTNPTYFAKSNIVQERLRSQGKFSREELLDSYKSTVREISGLIPEGSVSIEVYADWEFKAEDLLNQAREMNAWIPNAHIKFPIIPEGMKAAEKALAEGIRVNMTLCFSQEQAAAVYAMSKGAKKGDVIISPFMGRHFDAGRKGIDHVKNIVRIYKNGDGHVEVLAASLRSLEQFLAAIQAETDIITAGLKYIKLWQESGLRLPDENFEYNPEGKEPIEYEEFDLEKPWTSYDLENEMTREGLIRFAEDWNNLIKL